mmetsp:Transcript_12171/g.17618  ORF Transcript_12171/g.17618 Transcript_12171/m.17618 type:complete len:252 (+) Transcript_12171:20-775(+)
MRLPLLTPSPLRRLLCHQTRLLSSCGEHVTKTFSLIPTTTTAAAPVSSRCHALNTQPQTKHASSMVSMKLYARHHTNTDINNNIQTIHFSSSSTAPSSGQYHFSSESAFHNAANETLEAIQDAIECVLDDNNEKDVDVNYSDGVLTMSLGIHGTWVLNKQTPNRQIWWSSPLSGPRRYEYALRNTNNDVDEDDEEMGVWVYTRRAGGSEGAPVGELMDDGNNEWVEEDTLVHALQTEIREIYGHDLEMELE